MFLNVFFSDLRHPKIVWADNSDAEDVLQAKKKARHSVMQFLYAKLGYVTILTWELT